MRSSPRLSLSRLVPILIVATTSRPQNRPFPLLDRVILPRRMAFEIQGAALRGGDNNSSFPLESNPLHPPQGIRDSGRRAVGEDVFQKQPKKGHRLFKKQ